MTKEHGVIMRYTVEAWYSANDQFTRTEARGSYDAFGYFQGIYYEAVDTGFSPIHTFRSVDEVYQHFVDSRDIAEGSMNYIFWRVQKHLKREDWKKMTVQMDTLRDSDDPRDLIQTLWAECSG